MHKQALGGIPLDFGIVMGDKPFELSCNLILLPRYKTMRAHESKFYNVSPPRSVN